MEARCVNCYTAQIFRPRSLPFVLAIGQYRSEPRLGCSVVGCRNVAAQNVNRLITISSSSKSSVRDFLSPSYWLDPGGKKSSNWHSLRKTSKCDRGEYSTFSVSKKLRVSVWDWVLPILVNKSNCWPGDDNGGNVEISVKRQDCDSRRCPSRRIEINWKYLLELTAVAWLWWGEDNQCLWCNSTPADWYLTPPPPTPWLGPTGRRAVIMRGVPTFYWDQHISARIKREEEPPSLNGDSWKMIQISFKSCQLNIIYLLSVISISFSDLNNSMWRFAARKTHSYLLYRPHAPWSAGPVEGREPALSGRRWRRYWDGPTRTSVSPVWWRGSWSCRADSSAD